MKRGEGIESLGLVICNFLLSLLDASYKTTTITCPKCFPKQRILWIQGRLRPADSDLTSIAQTSELPARSGLSYWQSKFHTKSLSAPPLTPQRVQADLQEAVRRSSKGACTASDLAQIMQNCKWEFGRCAGPGHSTKNTVHIILLFSDLSILLTVSTISLYLTSLLDRFSSFWLFFFFPFFY